MIKYTKNFKTEQQYIPIRIIWFVVFEGSDEKLSHKY